MGLKPWRVSEVNEGRRWGVRRMGVTVGGKGETGEQGYQIISTRVRE